MAQMATDFQVGDYVAWKYGAGKARGHIVEKLTEDRRLGQRVFKASPDQPKFLLKIDKTGKEAIRKGDTLEKISPSDPKKSDEAQAQAEAEGEALSPHEAEDEGAASHGSDAE